MAERYAFGQQRKDEGFCLRSRLGISQVFFHYIALKVRKWAEEVAEMSLLKRYIKNSRGQALVEFALALPVLILLVIGMMDFGIIINQYMVVAEAAREGARSAALGGDNATVTTVAKTAASQINTSQLTVTISPSTTRVRGNGVTVTVATPVTITQLLRPFFPSGFTAQGAATMRVE